MATISAAAIHPSVRARYETGHWTSCPVNPAWVLGGKPVARIEHLSSSADGTASTYFWDCTAGRFNWFYTFDETLHVLEGSVTLKFPDGQSRHVAVGDVVFFPKGSSAEWTVESYIRCRIFWSARGTPCVVSSVSAARLQRATRAVCSRPVDVARAQDLAKRARLCRIALLDLRPVAANSFGNCLLAPTTSAFTTHHRRD